jgi:hypothetical protein
VSGSYGPRIRLGHRWQQTEHPHGSKNILAFGAAAVVTAEGDVDPRTIKIENRSNPAFELEIADGVMDDTRASVCDLRDLARRQPDAMHDA